jgi:site-specific DNA-methyltransferase (adenine-specific)
MQWLVKLITPPGGTVLDPFNGSGTTGIACKLEGFDYIGIDDHQEHCDISVARINAWVPEPEDYDNQLSFNFQQ